MNDVIISQNVHAMIIIGILGKTATTSSGGSMHAPFPNPPHTNVCLYNYTSEDLRGPPRLFPSIVTIVVGLSWTWTSGNYEVFFSGLLFPFVTKSKILLPRSQCLIHATKYSNVVSNVRICYSHCTNERLRLFYV